MPASVASPLRGCHSARRLPAVQFQVTSQAVSATDAEQAASRTRIIVLSVWRAYDQISPLTLRFGQPADSSTTPTSPLASVASRGAKTRFAASVRPRPLLSQQQSSNKRTSSCSTARRWQFESLLASPRLASPQPSGNGTNRDQYHSLRPSWPPRVSLNSRLINTRHARSSTGIPRRHSAGTHALALRSRLWASSD